MCSHHGFQVCHLSQPGVSIERSFPKLSANTGSFAVQALICAAVVTEMSRVFVGKTLSLRWNLCWSFQWKAAQHACIGVVDLVVICRKHKCPWMCAKAIAGMLLVSQKSPGKVDGLKVSRTDGCTNIGGNALLKHITSASFSSYE